jgi:hypothetical protein
MTKDWLLKGYGYLPSSTARLDGSPPDAWPPSPAR